MRVSRTKVVPLLDAVTQRCRKISNSLRPLTTALIVHCGLLAGITLLASPLPAFGTEPFLAPNPQIVTSLSQGAIDWKSFAPYAQPSASGEFPAAGMAAVPDAYRARPASQLDVDSNSIVPEATETPDTIEEDRPIDWHTILPDLVHDQRAIWTFPARLAKGEDWKPTLAFVVVLGALIAADSHDTPYFHRTTTYSGFNTYFTGTNTAVAALLMPPLFYAAGKLRKDSYATQTGLLMGEAILDSEAVAEVLKFATGRRRPYEIPTGGNYSDTWFETYHPFPNFSGGFPSGHAVLAFSVATVIARRYASHRWAPYAAYGAAALVCFSRLTLQEHFPSDVFAGAFFGYVISRDVVLPGRDPSN
jgi:membrane-associated phospholipid phosphatase